MKRRPVRLFVCVWGSYIDLAEKALVRSLCWSRNKAAFPPGSTIDLYTKKEDFIAAADLFSKIGINIMLHELPADLSASNPAMGNIILEAFKQTIRRCLDSNARCMIAAPDTIIGGNTVENLIKMSEQPGTVVFMPHVRVLPSILDNLEDVNGANRFGPTSSVSNAKLVTAAWRHLHKSWAEAECGPGIERANTLVGGVSWQKLDDSLYAVQHQLMTPYMINFIEEDLEHFTSHIEHGFGPVWGNLDHLWPAYCVVNRERARIVGSSDAAFAVEITNEKSNVPPLDFIDQNEPDKFWRKILHNQIMRQTLCVLRGE